MSRTLNITNGDCAVDAMRQAGIIGDYLPWRDLLHEGPVPHGLSLEALSGVRAEYIAQMGWGDYDQVLSSFRTRDQQLQRLNYYKKIILWFEFDLYDQLQMLQILDWFNKQPQLTVEISVICVDKYLSECSATELVCLLNEEQPLCYQMLDVASYGWQVFTQENPKLLSSLLNLDTSALPYLSGAVRRLLQEYPSTFNGLGLAQQIALKNIQQGCSDPKELFRLYQVEEARRFMADTVFFQRLLSLNAARVIHWPKPSWECPVSITELGEQVLTGRRHLLDIIELDYWVGGVHLTPDNIWLWDDKLASLARRGFSQQPSF
ncbi:hypothetical protein [Motilimonas sp. E26]|uniref:hypothetical protein n=1 Tax=Motilimonas sp. E26 TaxID=2865674 RepID=UPI001E518EF0|nr:hypothetical protein [Motilimonas sp. E26]MCE0557267.1 hypothetical protein [Motilimonas sp. E26]